ncbi:MAG: hypothetical protein ACI84B_000388 [Oceanospirillaceae bacterium]|jgi:hypothetical protein
MEKDLVRSLSYFNVAAKNGGLKSAKRMNDLAKDMTQAQIAEAVALAKRCIDSGYKDCE